MDYFVGLDVGVEDTALCVVDVDGAALLQTEVPTDPLEEAEGRPHSIIEKPGPDGQYTTHNGDGTFKQYRGSGKDHGDVPRPNVKENKLNEAPNGQKFPGKTEVRPPRPDEIPR